MNINFVNKCLTNIKWHKNSSYQVEGLLKQSNQYYKFDIRFLNDLMIKKVNLLILKVRQIKYYLKIIKTGY